MMTEKNQKQSIQHIMRQRRRQRLYLIALMFVVLGCAVALIVYAVGTMGNLYRLPSEITMADKQSGAAFRLGGFVEKGSVQHDDSHHVVFAVTDFKKSERVAFKGILPDLFREGQGVIVDGSFNSDGVFVASQVLAKHDEKYIPKDTVDRLKAEGLWEEGNTDAD